MTTSTQTGVKVYNLTTAAEFCAAGRKIRDALDAVGLVKTADSGQVDFDADAATSGYEVREFGDVFFKVSYSLSTGSFTGAWAWGTGTNGSGALTGNAGFTTYAPYSATSGYAGSEFKTLRVASDNASYLTFYLTHSTTTYAPSRLFAAQSVPPLTGHPFLAVGYGSVDQSPSGGLYYQNAYRLGDSPTGSMGTITMRPPVTGVTVDMGAWGSVDPTDVEVYVPKFRWSKTQTWWDFIPFVFVWVGEIPNDTPFTVNINGTDRTYITNSQFLYGNGFQQAYLWE